MSNNRSTRNVKDDDDIEVQRLIEHSRKAFEEQEDQTVNRVLLESAREFDQHQRALEEKFNRATSASTVDFKDESNRAARQKTAMQTALEASRKQAEEDMYARFGLSGHRTNQSTQQGTSRQIPMSTSFTATTSSQTKPTQSIKGKEPSRATSQFDTHQQAENSTRQIGRSTQAVTGQMPVQHTVSVPQTQSIGTSSQTGSSRLSTSFSRPKTGQVTKTASLEPPNWTSSSRVISPTSKNMNETKIQTQKTSNLGSTQIKSQKLGNDGGDSRNTSDMRDSNQTTGLSPATLTSNVSSRVAGSQSQRIASGTQNVASNRGTTQTSSSMNDTIKWQPRPKGYATEKLDAAEPKSSDEQRNTQSLTSKMSALSTSDSTSRKGSEEERPSGSAQGTSRSVGNTSSIQSSSTSTSHKTTQKRSNRLEDVAEENEDEQEPEDPAFVRNQRLSRFGKP